MTRVLITGVRGNTDDPLAAALSGRPGLQLLDRHRHRRAGHGAARPHRPGELLAEELTAS